MRKFDTKEPDHATKIFDAIIEELVTDNDIADEGANSYEDDPTESSDEDTTDEEDDFLSEPIDEVSNKNPKLRP